MKTKMNPLPLTPTISEVSRMLDSMLEVQRVLTRAGDHKRLALLYALTNELQDDYLSLLESSGRAVVVVRDSLKETGAA